MNEDEIIARIQTRYPNASIELSGENCSFEVYVVDEAFASMKTLARQRSLLDLFSDEITSGKLHALSVKARTPAEMTNSGGLVQLG